MRPFVRIVLPLLITASLAAGCGGPDQKKMKFLNKGKALYEKGDYVRAKLEFKNAVQIDPKFAEAFYMLGLAGMRSGNLNDAYGNLSKALELEPGHLKARAELAGVLLQGRQFDKAIENADLVLAKDAGNEKVIIVKGAALLAKGESAKARALMEDLSAKGSQTPDLFIVLSASFSQQNDARHAEEALRKGIELNPKSVSLNLALVDLMARSKRVGDAIEAMQHVVALDPAEAASQADPGRPLLGRGA